jgi:hypothetical protein
MSFISNLSAGIPSFFGFFVFCFGIIAGFFCLTILPYILLHSYIRFIYWFALGFFQKFENTNQWRQHIDYQLVGWMQAVNDLFGKQYLWQNYEIIFEFSSPESQSNFEGFFKTYFQNLHKKYYITVGYDTRKAWKYDFDLGVMSGSLNSKYLNVFHNLLKYDLGKSNIEVKSVVFIPNDESYFVQRAESESSGGG